MRQHFHTKKVKMSVNSRTETLHTCLNVRKMKANDNDNYESSDKTTQKIVFWHAVWLIENIEILCSEQIMIKVICITTFTI